jgi:hypothetical protein
VGRNKQIRKKIKGHQRMIEEHRAKIERELGSSSPRRQLIAYWEKRMREVELRILDLEERLGRH